MYRILIVEDDAIIARELSGHLSQWGYETACVQDFSAVLDEFSAFAPHLVLMDISLPFFNGFHWCAALRQRTRTPIIFLSAADTQMNAVMAMQMGGDDFISKPFDLVVLTAKVQALLRRTYDFSAAPEIIECRGALLDLGKGTLSVQGQTVELTRNEYRILRLLLENKGRVVTRDTIMTALWESDSFVDENTLTVNINRLRKKLDGASLPGLIRTKKGVGYLVEE